MSKEFIITAYSDNAVGVLNRITIMFTRRSMNIESLTVSESAIEGLSKFTIFVISEEEPIKKLCKQIERNIEVLRCFYHTTDEMICQEVALYKVPTDAIMSSDNIEKMMRKYNARVLEITKEYTVIEKTGLKSETMELFEGLSKFGVLQFIRSGQVAITKSPIERLSEFIVDRDRILAKLRDE